MKKITNRVKQGTHAVDMDKNDSVMTRNREIPYVTKSMKKAISVQLFLMNSHQHIMAIRMTFLYFFQTGYIQFC